MSLEAWKIEPSCSSSRRSSAALVILPLCATAILPLLQSTENGWALQQHRVAGGGIARVADRHVPGKLGQHASA